MFHIQNADKARVMGKGCDKDVFPFKWYIFFYINRY